MLTFQCGETSFENLTISKTISVSKIKIPKIFDIDGRKIKIINSGFYISDNNFSSPITFTEVKDETYIKLLKWYIRYKNISIEPDFEYQVEVDNKTYIVRENQCFKFSKNVNGYYELIEDREKSSLIKGYVEVFKKYEESLQEKHI